MTLQDTTRFFYHTMVPAIFLVPIWFRHGRYWMLGESGNWVVSDSDGMDSRALPGMILFHIVLWLRERKRRDHPIPEVALGLWGVYMLQVLVQLFLVVEPNPDEQHNSHHDDDKYHVAKSVASKFTIMTTTISNRMALGFAFDIWIIMGVTLFVSVYTPQDSELQFTTTQLLQKRMTTTVKNPLVVVGMVLWFLFGHLTLGSGAFSFWNTPHVLEALFLVWPLSHYLWRRYKNNRYVVTPTMAMALQKYIVLHVVLQLFVAGKHNFVVQYFHVPVQMTEQLAMACKVLLLFNIMFLLVWSHYYEPSEPPSAVATNNTDEENINNNGNPTAAAVASERADTLRTPLLQEAASDDGGGAIRDEVDTGNTTTAEVATTTTETTATAV